MNPTIVVVAFNRPKSLKRLLVALSNAEYHDSNVNLTISIDYENSKRRQDTCSLARKFEWNFGQKKVIEYTQNLGLRKHVLNCGDLTEEYDRIIMLEDDIVVSPCFYKYADSALDFYDNDSRIAGVSLYTHKKNFLLQLPFDLIPDMKDVFFLQIASSWGQAWSRGQWSAFREWLELGKKSSVDVPSQVKKWPNSSWLKLFINYMVHEDKYFVYPRDSYSTNYSDSGSHNSISNSTYQVPLVRLGESEFLKIDDSINVYDSHFEILPSRLKLLCPRLEGVDLTIDLFGNKNFKSVKSSHLLSSKILNRGAKSIESYGLKSKPILSNVISNESGNRFYVALKSDFDFSKKVEWCTSLYEFSYFFRFLTSKMVFKIIKNKVKSIVRV